MHAEHLTSTTSLLTSVLIAQAVFILEHDRQTQKHAQVILVSL